MALEPTEEKVSAFEKQSDVIWSGLDELVSQGIIYEHQAEAVKCLRRELYNPPEGHAHLRNVSLAVLPTGTGKTGVAILAAYACRARRVLVITPSLAISKQLLTQFRPVDDKKLNPLRNVPFILKRGIFNKAKERELWAPINSKCVLNKTELLKAQDDRCELVIANAHKFGDGKRGFDINEFDTEYFSLVIVDEAHHYPAVTWENIVNHFKSTKIIFLTATPWNKNEYILMEKPPCYTLNRKTAVEKGVIRPIQFDDFETQHLAFGEPDVGPETKQRNAEILTVLLEVKNAIQRHDMNDPRPEHRHKAMILAKNKEEAHTIAIIWNERVQFGECETFVEGDEPNIVDKFKHPGSEIKVLVVIFRLTEGFDCPNVSVVAILRNVNKKSRVYFAQFVGRAVRKLHRDDPVVATVLSHTVHNQRPNFETFEDLAEEDPDDNEE